MIGTPAIKHQVRTGQTHMIPGTIQIGKKYGMQSMNQALEALVQQGRISRDQESRYKQSVAEENK